MLYKVKASDLKRSLYLKIVFNVAQIENKLYKLFKDTLKAYFCNVIRCSIR